MTATKQTEKPRWQRLTPSHWAEQGGAYDCTSWVGPQVSWAEHQVKNPAPWPMYSFDRPSTTLWNAIARSLHEQGWKDPEIAEWLASKKPRWALDQELGDAIEALGEQFAKSITKSQIL